MISRSRTLCLVVTLAAVGCAGPEQGAERRPQRTSSEPLAAQAAANGGVVTVAPVEPEQAPSAAEPPEPLSPSSVEGSLDAGDGLQGWPVVNPEARGDAASEARVVAGDTLPNGPDEPASLFHFVPFEATGLVDPADFANWSEWLSERFLGDPDEARQEQLEALLSEAHIIDLTPVYINLVDGLDMADPDHVARAGELSLQWFLAQEKYKQMAINRELDDMRPMTVSSRMTALKAWVRWWQRTLLNETVERYRSRVDELTAKLEKMRKERRGQF